MAKGPESAERSVQILLSAIARSKPTYTSLSDVVERAKETSQCHGRSVSGRLAHSRGHLPLQRAGCLALVWRECRRWRGVSVW